MKLLTDNEVRNRLPVGFEILEKYKGMNFQHTFLCPLCKNEFKTYPESVFNGHTKSCGCLIKKTRKGFGELSGTAFGRILIQAKKRNLEFSVTIEDLYNLLVKQNFKCAISGLDIITGYFHKENRSKITASLDRIDSSRGYTLDNIQWVHKKINFMKNNMTDKEFVDFCKIIVNYQNVKLMNA